MRTTHVLCRLSAAVVLVAVAILAAPAPRADAASWFWAEVPAKIKEGSRAGALGVVRAQRAKGRRLFGSKNAVQGVLRRWRTEIRAGAQRSRIPEALLAAIILAESGGNPKAVSPAGAQGLAQLMPGTAARFGVRDSFSPAQNLRGASAYLSFLLRRFRGDLVLAIAAYNAGENAVDKHGGVPPYKETRNYVPRVLAAYDTALRMGANSNARREAKQYSWFWKRVPAAARGGSRSGALDLISDQRAKGRKMFGSRAALGRVLKKWRPQIQAAARKGRVSEALLAAIVAVSGNNPSSIGPLGAQGLAHLLPETAEKYRIRNPFDPAQNLIGAAQHLSDLIRVHRGDLVLALAAYNVGDGAVRQAGGVPKIDETRAFIPKVLSAFDLAGSFCVVPPRAAKRQCEFK